MEEAEALCTNISIFMAGKIKCIGSASALKHRLGDGFYVHIACNKGADDKVVRSYLEGSLPGLSLLNSLNGTLNFKIGSNGTLLGTILAALVLETVDYTTMEKDQIEAHEQKKHALGMIQDWGVENTTLEQVFVSITSGGAILGGAADNPRITTTSSIDVGLQKSI
jgi:hypothetical protein